MHHLMQRLLDQPIQHRRNAQSSYPALRLRYVHLAHRRRHVLARQPRLSYLRPVRLEPRFQLSHRASIDSRCAFIAYHALIRAQHVTAFHHRLHPPWCFRFRSPSSPRTSLCTRARSRQVPPAFVGVGRTRVRFCFVNSHRGLLSYSRVSRSALRSLATATMASADFWRSFPTPLDVSSTQADRQISPGMTHSPSRLCLSDLRRSLPCKNWALHLLACLPRCAASFRFLFVRPAFCLQLPSDSTSRWTPLPFA